MTSSMQWQHIAFGIVQFNKITVKEVCPLIQGIPLLIEINLMKLRALLTIEGTLSPKREVIERDMRRRAICVT